MVEKCKDCKTEMLRKCCSWGCLKRCGEAHQYCPKCEEFKS